MWTIATVTPAAFAPVSTSDMHTWLRLNDTSEDSLLTVLVDAATDKWTVDTEGHVLCSATYKLDLDHWPTTYQGYWPYPDQPASYPFAFNPTINVLLPTSAIYIPRRPVTAISLVEYLDTDANWQTLSGCTMDTSNTPARVILPVSLPQLHASQKPCVRVTFTAGYANAGAVPSVALVAVKLLASHWWAHREAFADQESKPVAQGWDALTGRYRLGYSGDWNR